MFKIIRFLLKIILFLALAGVGIVLLFLGYFYLAGNWSKVLPYIGLFFLVLSVWFIAFVIRSQKGRSRAAVDAAFTAIDDMDGHEFEYWCADLLKDSGFSKVQVTPGSNDQGVDIIAHKDGERYAVQCKRYSHALGNSPVQEVVAGRAIYRCDHAIVMTNNYFTDGALRAAAANDVELWDRDYLYALFLET